MIQYMYTTQNVLKTNNNDNNNNISRIVGDSCLFLTVSSNSFPKSLDLNTWIYSSCATNFSYFYSFQFIQFYCFEAKKIQKPTSTHEFFCANHVFISFQINFYFVSFFLSNHKNFFVDIELLLCSVSVIERKKPIGNKYIL